MAGRSEIQTQQSGSIEDNLKQAVASPAAAQPQVDQCKTGPAVGIPTVASPAVLSPTADGQTVPRPSAPGLSARELSGRAIVFGMLANVLFSMIATYLALKTGQIIATAIPISILAVGLSGFLLRLGLRRSATAENVNLLAIGSTASMVAAGTVFAMPAIYLLGLQDSLDLGSPTIFLHIFLIPFLGATLGVVFMVPLRRYFLRQTRGEHSFPEAAATNAILAAGQGGRTHTFVFVLSSLLAGAGAVCASMLRLWSETFTTGKLDITWVEKAAAGDKAGQWVGRSFQSLALPGSPGDLWYSLTVKFKAFIAMGTGAEFLGLGYIIGLRYAAAMVAGSMLSLLVVVPLLSQLDLGALQQLNPAINSTASDAIFNNIPRNMGIGCIFAAGAIWVLKRSGAMAGSLSGALIGRFRQRGSSVVLERTGNDISYPALGLMGIIAAAVMAGYCYFFAFKGMPNGVTLTLAAVVLALLISFVFSVVSGWATTRAGAPPISGVTVLAILIVPLVLLSAGLSGSPAGQLGVLLVCGVAASAFSVAGSLMNEFKLGHGCGASPKKIAWSCIPACALACAVVAAMIMLAARSGGFEGGASSTVLPAPHANLMKSAVLSILGDGEAPWLAYGVGAVIALAVQVAGISPLAFGLGMFLPMALTLPLLVGALIAAAVKWGTRDEATRQARHHKGLFIASGFVVGAALLGVINLALRGWAKAVNELNQLDMPSKLIGSGEDTEKVGQLMNWYGLLAFALLAVFMLVIARWTRRPKNVA